MDPEPVNHASCDARTIGIASEESHGMRELEVCLVQGTSDGDSQGPLAPKTSCPQVSRPEAF